MKNKLLFKYIILVLIVLCITACSKTRFDEIEELAEAAYEEQLEQGQYCNALIVAEKRIDVIYDNETPMEKYLKHSLAWQEKAKEVGPKCQEMINAKNRIAEEKAQLRLKQQQEEWDKQLLEIKPLVDKKIDDLNKEIAFFDQLQNIRMVALPQRVAKNKGHFLCVSTFQIINNSPVSIESLSFRTQVLLMHNRDTKQLDFTKNPITANESRNFELCYFYEIEVPNEVEMEVVDVKPVNYDRLNIVHYKKDGRENILEEIDNLKRNYEKGDLNSLLTSLNINKLIIPVGTSIDEEVRIRQDFNPDVDNSIPLQKIDQNYPIIPFDKSIESANPDKNIKSEQKLQPLDKNLGRFKPSTFETPDGKEAKVLINHNQEEDLQLIIACNNRVIGDKYSQGKILLVGQDWDVVTKTVIQNNKIYVTTKGGWNSEFIGSSIPVC